MRSLLPLWRPSVAVLLVSAASVTAASAAPATVTATPVPVLGSGVVAMDGTNALVGAQGTGPSSHLTFFHEVGGRWLVTPHVGAPPSGPTVTIGAAVALSGSDAIVSTLNTKTNARFIYFYSLVGTTWHLVSGAHGDPNTNPASESRGFVRGHYFALSVSLNHDWAFVADPGTVGGGSVVVYHQVHGWRQVGVIADPRHVAGDAFGSSVSLNASGSAALVGALNVSAANGSPANDGVAYLLRPTRGQWKVASTLHEPSTGPDNLFGTTVALSDTNVVVGAFSDAGPGQHLGNEGAVYCYRLNSSGATLTQVLHDPKEVSGDLFGASLAIRGSRVIVGATGVFRLVALRPVITGAAYLYDLTNPGVVTTVVAPTARNLGTSVAIGSRDALMLANGATATTAPFIVDARY